MPKKLLFLSLVLGSSFLISKPANAALDATQITNRVTTVDGVASSAATLGLAAGTLTIGASLVRRMIRL